MANLINLKINKLIDTSLQEGLMQLDVVYDITEKL